MIKVQINNICAKLVECEPLTSGMIGKLVEVSFSAEWDSLNKIAVFSNGDVTKDLYESQWNGNYIPIPQEVLATPHRTISMGIYGYEIVDGEKVLAIPTIVAEIGKTKFGADPSDDPAADPTLPIWAQLQWEIDHFEIPDEQIAIQVQAYLAEHPIEIQPATASVLGGVKVGEGLSVTADGTLSADGGGGGAVFRITATNVGASSFTTDKTYWEILDAYNNGYVLVLVRNATEFAFEHYNSNLGFSFRHTDIDDGFAASVETYRVQPNGENRRYVDSITSLSDAPADGKQYARQDNEWTEVISGGGQGWTTEQIDLLEAVFEGLFFTDSESEVAGRQLIESLRGGVVPEEPITITFDGTTAVISGLASTNINHSGTTAKIGYMPL